MVCKYIIVWISLFGDCCAVFNGSEGRGLVPICADVNTAPASTAFIHFFGCVQWQESARVKLAVPGTRFMQAPLLAVVRRTDLDEATCARCKLHAAHF